MRPLFRFLTTGLLVAGTLAVPSAATTYVRFTITDLGGDAGVSSDAGVDGTNEYADYRIDPSPPLNWCVDAEPYSAGNLFVRLNRKLDGDAGVLRCTENEGPVAGQPGTQRNFVLRIASKEACDILSDPDAGLPLTDAIGDEWVASSAAGVGSAGPCVLAHSDNPRIRLGTLYKARAKTTTVDFLTFMFGSLNSYEIRSESAAAITSSGAGHKRVEYTGTFRLVKFAPGKKTQAVGQPFAMPLLIDFYQ
jgi:hypothetical protein